MARMVVIYRTPMDKSAFNKHYFEVHVPMAKKLPGLRKYEVSHGPIITPRTVPDIYFIATLYFDDLASIQKAFATPEGQACAEDRKILAPGNTDAQIYLFDTYEV
jgi:uncharacterized protein (TIGR02118 family)